MFITCDTKLSAGLSPRCLNGTVGASQLVEHALVISVLNGPLLICLGDSVGCVICFVGYSKVAFFHVQGTLVVCSLQFMSGEH